MRFGAAEQVEGEGAHQTSLGAFALMETYLRNKSHVTLHNSHAHHMSHVTHHTSHAGRFDPTTDTGVRGGGERGRGCMGHSQGVDLRLEHFFGLRGMEERRGRGSETKPQQCAKGDRVCVGGGGGAPEGA